MVRQKKIAQGILPSQAIRRLIDQGAIEIGVPLEETQLQPASLDLRLGPEAFRLRASFLPGPGARVADKLDSVKLHKISLEAGAVLETGCVYLVPLIERLKLPEGLSAAANPKSSTGRIDVFTRVITDHASSFDTVAAGYAGPLYAEICPQTFPVLVREGSRLSQVRFRTGAAPSRAAEAEAVTLSVDLKGEKDGLIGYRARRHTGVVDVDLVGGRRIGDYWEPLKAERSGELILDPGQFYILASKEAVSVPPDQAAEMLPFDALVGEFRVHYAGFFDPGFGHQAGGGAGARAVLEVRSHDVPFILADGQAIGRLIYEPLTEAPEMVYGRGVKSNYQAQGLKLSKHFK